MNFAYFPCGSFLSSYIAFFLFEEYFRSNVEIAELFYKLTQTHNLIFLSGSNLNNKT